MNKKGKPFFTPKELAQKELAIIHKHNLKVQKYVIEAIKRNNSPFFNKDLEINICLNYNILKVQYMSGLIIELKKEIKEKNIALKMKDDALKMKDDALKMKEKGLLIERAEKFLERADKLELEAKYIIQDPDQKQMKMNLAQDLKKKAKNLKRQAKNI
ncbi:MAG: hypothetical protein K9W44_11075 [Candidatus Lokiarchaeota archaeon]|nr:hypothetical protein [Candidatus Harpocratesius repetitus]